MNYNRRGELELTVVTLWHAVVSPSVPVTVKRPKQPGLVLLVIKANAETSVCSFLDSLGFLTADEFFNAKRKEKILASSGSRFSSRSLRQDF